MTQEHTDHASRRCSSRHRQPCRLRWTDHPQRHGGRLPGQRAGLAESRHRLRPACRGGAVDARGGSRARCPGRLCHPGGARRSAARVDHALADGVRCRGRARGAERITKDKNGRSHAEGHTLCSPEINPPETQR
ncbi:hypothetical protein COLO4_02123 [Corchorus olitorius]|uniref:Uncharacterized protein n=1 Tax=Corchorus olitorius TaxID=93759 RepID=A0A1R3L1G0_9ROSI|nr:hypothetical protein COLO4_02123 [Corchorus olitorius]